MSNFEHKVQLSLEDFRKYDNDNEDYEFAYATVDFLSNRPNSHLHIYSEEVIKEYAPTVINKWVIAEYDPLTNDATTHTVNQKIVGRVPEQEVKYRYDNDGYLVATVDVVLSKLYATDVYEIFRNNRQRSISIEELVGFTEETEMFQDGIKPKEITGFNITGITILGLKYKPSVPNANIKITQMSEDSLENINNEYAKYSKVKSITMNDIMTKLNEIENKLSKEENMPENKDEILIEETVLNADDKVEEENMAENAEEKSDIQEQEEMACENRDEKMADNNDVVENAEQEVVENSEEVVENANEIKMSELETKLSEAELKISQYEAEIAELKNFKQETLNSEKNNIISQTLLQVKEYVDAETYENFANKGKTCEYENIGAWKNEVLASITEQTLAKMSNMANKEDGIVDLGMPQEKETKTSIFD